MRALASSMFCFVCAAGCASVEPLGSIASIDAGLSQAGQGGAAGSAEEPVNGVSDGAGGFVSPLAAGGTPSRPAPPPSGMGGFPFPGGPFGAGGRTGTGGRAGQGGVSTGRGGTASTASTAGGASGSAAGAPGAGGFISVGGSTSGPTMCAATEKTCGGVCVTPSPKVGCGTTGCDACTVTAPANGYVTCVSGACSFDCLSGYTKNVDKCDGPPPSTGGGSCPSSPAGCPDCGVVFGPGCCAGSKCGCSPIPWTVGILGCL